MMNEKEASNRLRRRLLWWRIPTLTLLLIAAGYLYISKHDHLLHTLQVSKDPVALQGSFKLKHVYRHGLGDFDRYHQRLDVTPEFVSEAGEYYQQHISVASDEEELWTTNEKYRTQNPFDFTFNLKSQAIGMTRMLHRHPDFVESYLDFARDSPHLASKVNLEWIDDAVLAPNISDKDTVVNLALMSSNAYVRMPHTGDWRNITNPWNHTTSSGHGWDGDGVRGHVFVKDDEDVVVIAVKGTSAQGLAGSGDDETTVNDKINDNLLFSCCCARISYLWTTVCDCYVKSYTCDETCLEKELRRKDRYYSAVLDVYRDVLEQYPNAAIWITGHSLGGAMASLVGRTYGLPAVAFEAPGELLASRRLHLPMPPGLPSYMEGVWHFGHTADPIFMGTCNGASSSCSIGGYAMETSCHSGKVCVYDVVSDKGWHVNMLNHRIHTVIDGVLNGYENVAKCGAPEPCHDCYNWNFIKGREIVTTGPGKPSTTKSKTTISTATTPAGTITVVPTQPATSSSCVGRNWLGFCTKYD